MRLRQGKDSIVNLFSVAFACSLTVLDVLTIFYVSAKAWQVVEEDVMSRARHGPPPAGSESQASVATSSLLSMRSRVLSGVSMPPVR